MKKTSLKIFIPAFLVLLLASFLFILQWNQYLLNRTVRNISLRIVQLEILSKRTSINYKIKFAENRYEVKIYNTMKNEWETYVQETYLKGVTAAPFPLELYFSKGRLIKYQYKNFSSNIRKSVTIYFSHRDVDERRAIIFYKNDNWKVLG
jgi:hypothetical protein